MCEGDKGSRADIAAHDRARDPSQPNGSDGAKTPEIKRLNSEAYKPWGTRSNNASPDLSAGSLGTGPGSPKGLSVCTGGPGKAQCNNEVMEGEGGVECEKCSRWYHSKCQGLSKGAMSALNKWHGTLVWLCDACAKWLHSDPKLQPKAPNVGMPDTLLIEEKINKLESIIRHNSKTLSESIFNQEKLFAVQCKVLDKLEETSKEDKQKQHTYAEALKGISTEVVRQVTEKN